LRATFASNWIGKMNRVFFRAAHSAAARRALLEKIIRVDHAGELGADRIYAGQMAVLQGSPVASVIKKMWDEEKEHLDVMERLAAKHEVPHTIFSPIFSIAAYALGVGSALLGKEGAMACTVAVEELIGQHYNNQLKELIGDDPEAHKDLLDTLTKLRDDELQHHDTGIKYNGPQAPLFDAMKFIIQTGCKGAIFMAERI
uniref:5-demethoxyubiquinone hydroxylase, mitochondrial n=1 Tax=Haemonchus contortus TaxID=6289 RepID=A0A7I4YDM7_HAECO